MVVMVMVMVMMMVIATMVVVLFRSAQVAVSPYSHRLLGGVRVHPRAHTHTRPPKVEL